MRRRTSLFASDRVVGYLFLLPAALVLIAVAFYPSISTFWMSLHDISLIFQTRTFAGLENFQTMLADGGFWNAYLNTIDFTFFSVLLETVFGLIIALIINENFGGRGLVRASVLVPWAIPTVVTSTMWGWIFNTDYGIANYLLRCLGLISENLNWLGNAALTMKTVIVADAWKTTPFMALILLAGLQSIPRDLYEAAKIDGAGWSRSFWHVTLPLVRPIMLVAVLLRTLDAFRVFDLVFVLTGGGPADSTEVMSSYTYKVLFNLTQFGYGSALAVMMFVTVAVVSGLFLWFLKLDSASR